MDLQGITWIEPDEQEQVVAIYMEFLNDNQFFIYFASNNFLLSLYPWLMINPSPSVTMMAEKITSKAEVLLREELLSSML